MSLFIGRKEEKQLLKKALNSHKAEMIAVIGRRRVGKTHLIDTVYENHIIFKQTGVRNASATQQLRTFSNKLRLLSGKEIEPPKDWLDAFFLLRIHLEPRLRKDKKVVLFFDELSWLAVPESGFLDYLGYFWNDWAVRQNLIIVICGSASSWIIQKVINDKGGLHNRVTQYIHLKPFTLGETKIFLEARNINFDYYQTVQLYMALGGIPLYLEAIEQGQGAAQNIDRICFSNTGLLKNEFSKLYPALFENADYHIEVIRTLAQKRKGMTRSEIIAHSKLPNGSTTTRILEELLQSDFIMAYHPFEKKKKDKLYRLIDEYSLFYLKFIENKPLQGRGTWIQISQTQEYKIWTGYAYEGICMKHIPFIKKALGISGVYTTTYSYFKKATKDEKGLQIDMLLDRADQLINLFEIKFYNTEFVLSKAYAERLRERLHLFRRLSKTKKQVFLTLITTYGLKHNQHSLGLVENVLKLEDLFLATP